MAVVKAHLVLSAIGPDRPGIVDEVTEFLLRHRCSLEDSRMAILGGEFALVVLVVGQPGDITAVREGFPPFANEHGMVGTAKETKPTTAAAEQGFVPFQVRAIGLDHEGIVHHIAHTLRELGANIESVETQSTSAPVSGAPMFALTMRIAVPARISPSQLQERMQATGDEVNVDLTVQAV